MVQAFALYIVLRCAGGSGPLEPAAQQGRQAAAGGRVDARLRDVPDEGAADPDEPAQGQRALLGVPFARAAAMRTWSRCRRGARHTRRSRRGATSSASRGWSCRVSRSRACCSPIRSPRKRAAATGTAAASTGSRRTTRSGRPWPPGCVRRPGASPAAAGGDEPLAAARPTLSGERLSFEMFRTKVQPILTSPRKGNARCTACHARGGGNAYLEPLPAGSTTYTEEQSRRNFERVVAAGRRRASR